jgi:cysteine synthase
MLVAPGIDMEVYDSILDTIGNTPIVRLPKLNRGLKPNLLAKLEMFTPGATASSTALTSSRLISSSRR